MKKEIYLSIFLLIIFSINFVSAIDTQINVRTWPNHKVSIFILKTGEAYYLLNSYHLNSDSTGQVSATYSGDESRIMITVKITKNGQTVMLNKFEDEFTTGSPIYLQVIPRKISNNYMELEKQKTQAENITNQTINQTTQNISQQISSNITNNVTIETSSSQTQQITGAVITEDSPNNKSSLKYIFYVIFIGIILGLAVFFFYKKNQNISNSFQHHGKVVLKHHPAPTHDLSEYNKPIHHEQRKYQSNNQEFLKLKNQRRMDDLKRRMQQDLEEFKRLEKGSF